jgi:hypothetical protein
MATTTLKRPLRVPKGNPTPIPGPTPFDDDDSGPQAPETPLPAPFEDEEDDDTPPPSAVNVGAALNEAAKARMAARKLPPLPPKITFEEFISYWRQLSGEQKSHISLYWYRLKPVIDRQLVDKTKTKYIDVAGSDEQMTYEYMLNQHGGGVYQGIVNDTDIRKNGQITNIMFEIPLSQFDPVIDLEELDINHRENQTFVNKLKAKGTLTSDGRINKNPSAETRKDDIMSSSIVNRLLDAALEPKRNLPPSPPADSGISNLVLEMMKQNNPNNQLATLLAVVEKLKPSAPVEKPDTALEYLKLMEMQRANYESKISALNDKLMEILSRPAPVPEKSNIAEEIDKIKSMAEALGMGSGGGKTSWVDRLIDTVGPAIPGVVDIISKRLNANPNPTQGNPGYPRMPNELETPMGALPAPSDPTKPVEENNMAFLDMVIATGGNDFLNAIANGVPGYDAADSIINLKGKPTYMMIIKDGEKGIIEAIQRNPQFVQQLSRITTEAKLNQWIHEFVHAEEYGEDGEGPSFEPETEEKKGKVN